MDDRRRAHLYRSLAHLLDAGIEREPLSETLLAGQRCPDARAVVEQLGADLRAGLALADAMEGVGLSARASTARSRRSKRASRSPTCWDACRP